MGLCRRIDGEAAQVRENLTSREVALSSIEHGLGRTNIVLTVFHDVRYELLRNRIVPGDLHLHVGDSQLDLPLLQAHLHRREVVDVGIRQVVCFPKHHVSIVVDDSLGNAIDFAVVEAHVPCVENMIIVSTVVETDEFVRHQVFDRLRCWVHHAEDFVRALVLPTND